MQDAKRVQHEETVVIIILLYDGALINFLML